VLFVRSAGNDGAALNSGDDGAQCRPGDEHQVLVGAYGVDGERSSFTNFGNCVDVYAPGEAIVAPLPGDWLTLVSGTSFSAPLVARMLAIEAPTPFTPETARAFLAHTRLANRNLELSHFPPEVVFDVQAAAKSALTASSPSAPAAAARTWSPAVALSAPPVRRALWPLGWATRYRRHR